MIRCAIVFVGGIWTPREVLQFGLGGFSFELIQAVLMVGYVYNDELWTEQLSIRRTSPLPTRPGVVPLSSILGLAPFTGNEGGGISCLLQNSRVQFNFNTKRRHKSCKVILHTCPSHSEGQRNLVALVRRSPSCPTRSLHLN